MTRNRIAVLVIGALAAASAAWFVTTQKARETSAIEKPQRAFPELAAKGQSLAKITITGSKSKVTLVRNAKGDWGVAEWAGFPAHADLVNRLFLDLSTLELTERRSAKPDDHQAMGLVGPEAGGSGVAIEAFDQTGARLAGVIQGRIVDPASGTNIGSLYVRMIGDDQAWLARSNLPSIRGPQEWGDRILFQVPAAQVFSVDIRKGTPDAIRLLRNEASKGELSLVDAPKGRQVDSSAIANIAGVLGIFAIDGAKAKDGVDMTGAQVVQFLTREGTTIQLLIKSRGDQSDVAISAGVDEARLAANAEPIQELTGPAKSEAVMKELAASRENQAKLAREQAASINAKTQAFVVSVSAAKLAPLLAPKEALFVKPKAANEKGAKLLGDQR
jgi:hypothetical protein